MCQAGDSTRDSQERAVATPDLATNGKNFAILAKLTSKNAVK